MVVPTSGTTDTLYYDFEEGYHFGNGDANGNEFVNILDVTYLISYLYKNGPAPNPLIAGDSQCNGIINILDVTYIIGYLYKGGQRPCPFY